MTEDISSSSAGGDVDIVMSSSENDEGNYTMNIQCLMMTFIFSFITIIKDLQENLLTSGKQVDDLKEEIKRLMPNVFCYKKLPSEEIEACTNLRKESFDVLCQYLRRFEPYNYWSNFTVKSISHEDQLLICLMKLKLNLRFFDIGRRYSVSRATVHNIYMTYLHLLREVLFMGILNKIPSIEKIVVAFLILLAISLIVAS